jgi:hypothetical protein
MLMDKGSYPVWNPFPDGVKYLESASTNRTAMAIAERKRQQMEQREMERKLSGAAMSEAAVGNSINTEAETGMITGNTGMITGNINKGNAINPGSADAKTVQTKTQQSVAQKHNQHTSLAKSTSLLSGTPLPPPQIPVNAKSTSLLSGTSLPPSQVPVNPHPFPWQNPEDPMQQPLACPKRSVEHRRWLDALPYAWGAKYK